MTKGQAVKVLRKKDVKKIISLLKKREKIVILGVVIFCLNTGLRISDVLLLKFEDIENSYLKEKKTQKNKHIIFNDSCKIILKKLTQYYIKNNRKDYNTGYIFKSTRTNKHISYQGINYYITKLRTELNINYPFNTHSFRKTWARAIYDKYNNIVLVMKLLNHTNPAVTLRYIGIEEEEILKVYSEIIF